MDRIDGVWYYMVTEKDVICMKKANILLAVLLSVLVIAIVYFIFGTDMKVDAAAARENGYIRCELTLSNGSLFDYEYLEFILLSPDGAEMGEVALTGQNIGRLTQERATVVFRPVDDLPCEMEIGYYVYGRRKSVTVTVQ